MHCLPVMPETHIHSGNTRAESLLAADVALFPLCLAMKGSSLPYHCTDKWKALETGTEWHWEQHQGLQARALTCKHWFPCLPYPVCMWKWQSLPTLRETDRILCESQKSTVCSWIDMKLFDTFTQKMPVYSFGFQLFRSICWERFP